MKHKSIAVFTRSIGGWSWALLSLASFASAQQALTWDQVKAKFEAANPVLKADAANVEEMKAEEITAFLRPNPQFTLSVDGTQIAPHNGVWTPSRARPNSLTSVTCTSANTSGSCACRAPRKARRLPSPSTLTWNAT